MHPFWIPLRETENGKKERACVGVGVACASFFFSFFFKISNSVI
jgi:hypothetical protein